MASQLIVLVLGLSGSITCKLSNVYYSAAHGKFLVQSTASYAFESLGIPLEIKVSTQTTLAVKDLSQVHETLRGKKTRI